MKQTYLQMYNIDIQESILEQITVSDFAEACKHLPSPDYATYTKNHSLQPKNKWLTLNVILEASRRANFGFMNDKDV